MRKLSLILFIGALTMILTYCSSSKKAAQTAVAEPAKSTYAANLKTVIEGNCSPCHIPSKGGNKKAYDNFANVKTDIDEMIRRIELAPTERGFMPFKKTKLNDSTIAVFKQWKTDGMLEN